MSDDFYPFVDSGDPAPDNAHLTGGQASPQQEAPSDEVSEQAAYACRIAVYDDMLSTPRVIVVAPQEVRTYLEEVTNTVYRCMKEQGGHLSLMVIRELVENFIHAHFCEPIISVLDDGNTIRFADQGPGIADKEMAFEFGVTSADRNKKRYIRGTGAGFPMVQQYLENAGGAISLEDNLGQGTVVTVSVQPARVREIEHAVARGAAVRPAGTEVAAAFTGPVTANVAGTVSGAAAGTAGAMVPNPQAQGLSQGSGAPKAPQPQQTALAAPAQAGATGMPVAPQQIGYAAAPSTSGQAGYPVATSPVQPGYQTAQLYYPPEMYQQGIATAGAAGTAAYPGYPVAPGYAVQPYAPAPAYPMPTAGYGVYPGMPGTGAAVAPQAGAAEPNTAYPIPANGQPRQPAPAGVPGVPTQSGAPAAPMTPQPAPYVSDRGRLALAYLAEHETCGPTELTRAYGSSAPTWTRELDALTETGLVVKRGQKRTLTDMGRLWLQSQAG